MSMHNPKLIILTVFTVFYIRIYSQESFITTISDLEVEIENLKTIEQSLRAELASMRLLDSNTRSQTEEKTVNGYSLRYMAPALSVGIGIWVLSKEFINGKYVYAIKGFANPHQAFAISQQLRTLERNRPQVVFNSPPAINGAKKRTTAMTIED